MNMKAFIIDQVSASRLASTAAAVVGVPAVLAHRKYVKGRDVGAVDVAVVCGLAAVILRQQRPS
jgi:hypothetical protein